MNAELLKAEVLMLQRMIGSDKVPIAAMQLGEKYRRAFLNGGGTGVLPAMTLATIAVQSGAMSGFDSAQLVAVAAPMETKLPQLPEVDEDDDIDAGDDPEDEAPEGEDLTPGRLVNYKTSQGGWKPARFHSVAEKEGHVKLTTAGRQKPFLVHVKNLDVPDLTKPAPSG